MRDAQVELIPGCNCITLELMRTIVWHIPPEYGHYAPTRLLSKQLVAQGCRVVYVCELDMKEHLERDGFEHVPYLPEAYPVGSITARDRLDLDATWEWWFNRDQALWREACSGRLEALLATLSPDLVIGDQLNPDTSLVVHKMKLPFIRITTMLPAYYEPDMPPIWSDALPGERSRWELEIEWMCHGALVLRQPWIHRDNPIKPSEFFKFVEACGINVAQINYRSAFNYHVESDPEIVMCSKAFDFPKPAASEVPDRVYIGPCLSENDAKPWTYPARRREAPLIYCAFGSKSLSYPTAKVVIERLLELAVMRPELDIVIAAYDEVVRGLAIPPTVHVIHWAPQRAILREADLFITHAGLNSIREAIWEGVPMLAVPQAYDQRGCAARIVYHHLGERITGPVPATPVLAQMIDRLLGDATYRQAVEQMQTQFHAEAQDLVGARFVLDVLEKRIVPASGAYYDEVVKRLGLSLMPVLPT